MSKQLHSSIEHLYGDSPEDPNACRKISVQTSHATVSFILTSTQEEAVAVAFRMREKMAEVENMVTEILMRD